MSNPHLCSVDGCDKFRVARGLCTKHYQRQIKTGEVELLPRRETGCSAEGCEERARKNGMCVRHWRQWISTADAPTGAKPPCHVDGCDNDSRHKGLCGMHYKRWVRTGTTELAPGRRAKGSGHLTSGGYVGVPCPPEYAAMGQRNGRSLRVLQHRLVVAQSLGRCLAADETVHHLDGNKQNNALSNLELRLGAHGKHQSVPDIIAAAVAALQRYAPEKLA